MKRLYSFVKEFLTKRWFCDANANQTQQPPRDLHPQDLQGRVLPGLCAASVAAGPKGRTANASTDATMRAEVLSYSRARGLFAGISLEGSTVRPDDDANERVYGGNVSAEAIIFKGAVAVPPAAQKLVAFLNRKSPKKASAPNSLKE